MGDGKKKKKEIQKVEINRARLGKDREDGVFYSSSFNLFHDSNSSICNEDYDEPTFFSRVFLTLTTI